MLLYHGTTEAVARRALVEGLKPRGKLKQKSKWTSCPSNPRAVYLTCAYAGYFAMNAVDRSRSGKNWAIVEVDTDFLDKPSICPDEDFLEQVTRGRMRLPCGDEMVPRTMWFRQNIRRFQHLWEESLNGLGTVCYYGDIPSSAITRVSVYDPRSNPLVTLAIDPMISITNFQFCRAKYETVTAWLMGEDVSVERWANPWSLMMPAGAQEQLRHELSKRSGLTIIERQEDGRLGSACAAE